MGIAGMNHAEKLGSLERAMPFRCGGKPATS